MQANRQWTINFLAKWQDEKDAAILERSYKEMILTLDPEMKFKPEWVANSIKLAKLAGIDDVPEAKDIFVTQFTPVKYR
jgi:NitT/TauT family transport system substrate-binding protein